MGAAAEWTIGLGGPAVGLLIAVVTAPVGVSGAVFLPPVQLGVFGVSGPAATPANLLLESVSRFCPPGARPSPPATPTACSRPAGRFAVRGPGPARRPGPAGDGGPLSV
ncbi:hypothetical protein [Streptomyces umbrinus]|uniref:hypothetical protein n=1 Tax=Streptomyces umbrinus TaxID=67370 RepID=UPI003C2FF532